MDRRRFLIAAAGAATLPGCSRLRLLEQQPAIQYPGMHEGHLLRDRAALPAPSGEIATDVLILGSGMAALMAAWRLSREGHRRFLVLSGPEPGGNASGGSFGDLGFPRGAHYIPLPSMESVHVRELLADLQLLSGDPRAARPMFDERALVHAPESRVFHAGRWQDGTLPTRGIEPEDRAQQERFFREIDSLKRATGADGRRAFTIPVAQASTDPRWRALDAMTFAAWLDRSRYTSRVLRWYLDYVCQDDYGTGADRVSAWAGLHYFASRGGHARNAEDGAVLTWPDGLHSLVERMRAAITARAGNDGWQRAGFAARVQARARDVEVLALTRTDSGLASFTIRAQRAICAMPLLVASRVVDRIGELGFDPHTHVPAYAPWLVSNFLMKRFPAEREGVPLAWDNVVFEGRGLGYVVSTHQDIRLARPPHTVFSAYRALADRSPDEARRWLAAASPEALYDEAACDLSRVYGWRFALHAQALDVTVRGHAMASPLPGFLSNAGTRALREADGRLLFAHADLSGYSVFEEAAWWGEQAARKVLA